MMLLVGGQLLATIAAGAVAALLGGSYAAYSALSGGLIGVIPSFYLAARMSGRRGGAGAEQALRRIYVGEMVKIAFTVALFIIAIVLLNADFLIVLLAYAATVAVNWVVVAIADIGETPRRDSTAGQS